MVPVPSFASEGSTKRIIFLNRYFYPDHSPTSELLSDLAFTLAERGYRVSVITSRLTYENAAVALPHCERVRGVEVWRVWTSKRGRQQLGGRALDYLTFYLVAGWRLWRLARAGDIVVAKTDPPLLSIVVAPIGGAKPAPQRLGAKQPIHNRLCRQSRPRARRRHDRRRDEPAAGTSKHLIRQRHGCADHVRGCWWGRSASAA